VNKEKHLNAFNELRRRLWLMERDMLKNRGFKKLVERIKVVYISTIKELMRRGKKYLSLNPETKNTIRVSIDMDKYLSILEDIDIKKSKEK
jgi:primosomal protein N'|tara:strand:+ start:447 stop:719 length:273 start_codon:yes stop_codon:yes gene_type:complete